MTVKLSRTMLDNLAHVQDDWTQMPYDSSLDPLLRRGLVEVEHHGVFHESWRTPFAKLTDAGCAALGGSAVAAGSMRRNDLRAFSPEEAVWLIDHLDGSNDPLGQSIHAKLKARYG